jgi:hypothetical protein
MRHKRLKEHKNKTLTGKQKTVWHGKKTIQSKYWEKPQTLQKTDGLKTSQCRMCLKEIMVYRQISTSLHTWLGADLYLAD